jgi:hypothetical protein
LAVNQEAQEKLYAEVKRVVGDKNKPITTGHLAELSYLKNCLKEGFR